MLNLPALKCSKCGKKVCRRKAVFYKPPLRDLCVDCRKEELKKLDD